MFHFISLGAGLRFLTSCHITAARAAALTTCGLTPAWTVAGRREHLKKKRAALKRD
jgi:hypothetical protein